jgi:hypothetical protein
MPAAAPSNAPATTVPWLFGVSLGFVVVSVFCVSLGVVFVFVGFQSFLVALHGDSSMDYVSIQPKSPFDAHCRHDDVATALIRGICKMQLAVQLDEQPGESHMALDGKKNCKVT